MKILVYEPNWLGDVIFTSPAPEALKKHFKGSFIGCVVPRRCADALRYNPYVDEIIEFDERAAGSNLLEKIKFISTLSQKKYDMSILFHRSLSRTLFCCLAGIKKRVGYAYRKRAFLLTGKISPVSKDSLHKQDYYLNILEKMGVRIEDKNCRFYLSEQQRNWAAKFIEKHSKDEKYLIAINPLSNWPPKDWGIENYTELISLLKEKLNSVKFFITSKNKDDRIAPLIEKHKEALIDLSGGTSLLELAGLYEKMNLVISGDSGPLHLGAALNTKYLGLYGPTNPFLTGVRAKTEGEIIFENNSCSTPCYIRDCEKDYICLSRITPQRVLEAALKLLKC